jgi:hypothetical protein
MAFDATLNGGRPSASLGSSPLNASPASPAISPSRSQSGDTRYLEPGPVSHGTGDVRAGQSPIPAPVAPSRPIFKMKRTGHSGPFPLPTNRAGPGPAKNAPALVSRSGKQPGSSTWKPTSGGFSPGPQAPTSDNSMARDETSRRSPSSSSFASQNSQNMQETVS